jgi:CHAD domain-containing protein
MKVDTDDFCSLGAVYLLRQVTRIAGEEECVKKNTDIECLHRMRVATRRYRAVCRYFDCCLPAGKRKKWRKAVTSLGKALGEARDLDVRIVFLKEWLEKSDQSFCRPGLKRLLLRMVQKRERMQLDIQKRISAFTTSSEMDEMIPVFQGIIGKAHVGQSLPRDGDLVEKAKRILEELVAEIFGYDPLIGMNYNLETFHSLRKTVKNTRYFLETLKPLDPLDRLIRHIDFMKHLQDDLGSLNDAFQWVTFLEDFLEDERARTLEYYGHMANFRRIEKGICFFLEDRRRILASARENFTSRWKDGLVEAPLKSLLADVSELGEKAGSPEEGQKTGRDNP